MTKYGSKMMTSSPGLTTAAECQQEGPEVPEVIEDLAVGVAELGVDGGLELAPKLGDALGERVGVVPVLRSPRLRRP